MKTKLLEIRGDGLFIPVLALQLDWQTDDQRYLLARAGLERDWKACNILILVFKIYAESDNKEVDPHVANSERSVHIAQQHIKKNWDDIVSGDVIDIEFILGETKTMRTQKRLEGMRLRENP